MIQTPYPNSVLVVGPSASLGGIASVMRLHSTTKLWDHLHCHVLSTYDEQNVPRKILAMLRAYTLAPVLIHKADLVHIHVAAQHSMWRKLPIVLLTKLLRKPYVVHLHAASEASLFEHTPQWLVRAILLLSYRVIVLSDHWASIVKRHVADARVTIIHNPVPLPPPSHPIKNDSAPVILFVGKLEARKGYRNLLDAAPEILERFPNARFWFVGHGEVQQALQHAASRGLQNSVSCTGWIDADDMEYYYRSTSIFCLPSYDEGLPMAVLEAMSYALPVVCTRVGGLPDIISDRRNGFFATVGDAHSIAHCIIELLADPALANRIGEHAALTIERECGIARIEQKLADLYREVDAEWTVRRHGRREADIPATSNLNHR